MSLKPSCDAVEDETQVAMESSKWLGLELFQDLEGIFPKHSMIKSDQTELGKSL